MPTPRSAGPFHSDGGQQVKRPTFLLADRIPLHQDPAAMAIMHPGTRRRHLLGERSRRIWLLGGSMPEKQPTQNFSGRTPCTRMCSPGKQMGQTWFGGPSWRLHNTFHALSSTTTGLEMEDADCPSPELHRSKVDRPAHVTPNSSTQRRGAGRTPIRGLPAYERAWHGAVPALHPTASVGKGMIRGDMRRAEATPSSPSSTCWTPAIPRHVMARNVPTYSTTTVDDKRSTMPRTRLQDGSTPGDNLRGGTGDIATPGQNKNVPQREIRWTTL